MRYDNPIWKKYHCVIKSQFDSIQRIKMALQVVHCSSSVMLTLKHKIFSFDCFYRAMIISLSHYLSLPSRAEVGLERRPGLQWSWKQSFSRLKSIISHGSIHHLSDQYETQLTNLLNLLWSPPQSCSYLIFSYLLESNLHSHMKRIVNGQKVTSVMMHKVIQSGFQWEDKRYVFII